MHRHRQENDKKYAPTGRQRSEAALQEKFLKIAKSASGFEAFDQVETLQAHISPTGSTS
jgi:hypothetical protein